MHNLSFYFIFIMILLWTMLSNQTLCITAVTDINISNHLNFWKWIMGDEESWTQNFWTLCQTASWRKISLMLGQAVEVDISNLAEAFIGFASLQLIAGLASVPGLTLLCWVMWQWLSLAALEITSPYFAPLLSVLENVSCLD